MYMLWRLRERQAWTQKYDSQTGRLGKSSCVLVVKIGRLIKKGVRQGSRSPMVKQAKSGRQNTGWNANGTYTLHDFQSRQISVLITLHDCLSYNGVSWSCCGLHITRVIGDRGSHIARHFTGRNPQQVCLVSKLCHSQQNTREKWYGKRNRCPQETSDPSCLCADLQRKTKEEKEKNKQIRK